MKNGTIPLPKTYSLDLTLNSGQVFRWMGPDPAGIFQGVAGGAYWRLKQDGCQLEWSCSLDRIEGQAHEEWLFRYLRLDDDLGKWAGEFGSNPLMHKSLKALRGMGLIRQDPFECAVSYLYAQGLSVSVIQRAIGGLCTRYGEPISGVPGDAPASLHHAFPSAETLAGLRPAALRRFANNNLARAKHIVRLARDVEAGRLDWERLKAMSCDEARADLMRREGIGPKIADCILLFSLDHLSAFPLDRWVYRAMRDHFGFKGKGAKRDAPTRVQYREMTDFARREFGPRCGVASEYLFLYLRRGGDDGLKVSV